MRTSSRGQTSALKVGARAMLPSKPCYTQNLENYEGRRVMGIFRFALWVIWISLLCSIALDLLFPLIVLFVLMVPVLLIGVLVV